MDCAATARVVEWGPAGDVAGNELQPGAIGLLDPHGTVVDQEGAPAVAVNVAVEFFTGGANLVVTGGGPYERHGSGEGQVEGVDQDEDEDEEGGSTELATCGRTESWME